MSEVATKNITFWNTTDYKYPGFGKTLEVPDGLGGTIGITYNQIDYDDRGWRGKPDGDTPITEDRFLSGEIENNFSLTGKVKGITATMPQIRTLGKENNYSVTLDFSKYKASAAGSKATDGATSGDTYLAISRFFNGSKTGYTTIKVTAKTVDGSELNLGDWKLFNSGALPNMGRWGGHNARIFLDVANQTISGKNSEGKQEFCPTPPNPGSSFGTDTGLGLFELPSNQRYVSITLSFKQKKIQGGIPNDLHDIYVASNTSSTGPIDATPQPTNKPVDINNGLQLHLPLNEIVENAESEKEVVDISAGKFNGKVHGATVVTDSKFGNCLNFDGVDDYIQMPQMNIDYSQGFTVEAWVYYNSFKNQSRVIDFANGPGKNNIIFGNHTTTNDGLLVVFVGSTRKAIEVKGILEVNKWLHLTATIDESGNAKVYKDGQEVGGGLVAIPNSVNRSKNYIGVSNWSGDGHFHGKMSNLRVYNRVLSKEEINECMAVDGTPPPMDINNGLQLHLPLNEIVENAAKEKEVVDVSVGKLKGKVNGNPTVVDDSQLGSCLNFDGVDDYIQMPEMNLDYSQGFTVGAWVNYNSFKSWSRIIDFGNGQGNDNIVFANEGTTKNLDLYVYKGATQNRIKADGMLELNQWLYVTVTVDGSGTSKIYKNGEEVQSGSVHLPNNVNRTKNYIGESNWPNDAFFHGKMSHLRVYNRALSKEEINECMKVDGTPPPMDINRGLQLHLPLNEIVENAAKEKEVVDTSGKKLNSKVNGATVVADDRFGNCINFDGVDDYIELPATTIPQTGEITISFWANGGKSLPKQNSIILAVDKSNHRVINIHLPWSNSHIYFDCGNTATSDDSYDRIEKLSQAVDFKDKWTHWVFTKNVATGEINIYLNGTLWQSGTGKNQPISSITQVKLGAGYGFYDGKIAHLRIYDRVLSPEEINECMKVDGTPPPMDINSGLQLHLPLNEIVENDAKEKEVADISAGKLKGKVNGNPIIVDDSQLGNCINFDGVDDYIELPVAAIPQSDEITISFWANGGKSLPKTNSILWAVASDKINDYVVNIHLPWSDSQIYFDCGKTPTSSNSYNRIQKIAEAVDFKDKWSYWTFTKNVTTGEMNIYLNGTLWHSGTGKNKSITSITQVKVGAGYGFYDGKMANLRIYDRVLSPEEINECMKVDGTPPPMDINRGLQLHLPLNEIVENSAKEKEVVDISTSQLNGKVNGATVVADDRFGNCINFDGVDNNIQIPEMNVDYSKGFTVEAWCYSSKFKNYSRIIDFANGPTDDNIIFSHYVNNSILLALYLGSKRKELILNKVFENNQWLHLAATVDQLGNAKVYKNGQQVGEGLLAVPNTVNRTKNYLGNTQNAKSPIYFQGKMSNLRLYNRPLSPEEINECIKVDQTLPLVDINRGLQLHLPLNEIVENATKEKEIVDISSAKLNAKVNGATVVADSRFGNCINFDGVDDYIELPTTTIPETGEITISFWANGGKSLPKQNSIILALDKSNHRVINIHLPWSNSHIYFDCGNTATSDDSYDRIEKLSQAVDFKDKWTHWVFTKNVAAGEMNIYLNGTLWQSGTGKNQPISSITQVKFGAGYGFYDGKVANLRIYDRVLSPEEINECMKLDGTPAPMDINRGLQLHLPLNEIVENDAKEKEVVDISSAKLNAKVNGATVVADSRFGNCINFDGVDDYIELPATTIPQTGEITISFWANGGKSLPKQNSIILAVDKSNHRVINIHLPWSNSHIYFDCGNTATSDDSYDRIEKLSQAVDFKDKWTHWVFTKNVATGEINIYLNGTLWQSGTGKNQPISSITQVKFGAGYGFYDGKMANLRIYDRVLSPEEINELMQVDEADATETASTTGADDATPTTDATDTTSTTGADDATPTTDATDTTSTTDAGDATPTTDATETASTTDAGDATPTTDATETASTTDAGDATPTTDATETTSTTGAGDATPTTETTETTSTTGAGDATPTTETTETTSTTGAGDATPTTETTETASTTGADATDTSSTTEPTDTTQKPMEYQIYQVNGNPTIKTGYPASEWTAVIAGFNCGAQQKHKATALTIMPVVDDGEWKIKCDIKDADDRYWDVAVLFIRNNMVNRISNFYR